MSKKRASDNVLYRTHVHEWIEDRIRKDGYLQCQFVGKPWADHVFGVPIDDNERCIMAAMNAPHHKKGRGKYLADKRFFMAACAFHHQHIEDHKKDARKRGYILYK